ncbi:lysophospholipid acyltransferase family protein [Psychromarinibacter sp. S121]|uniref:lysophospholipid acyltransferase family protein n=1 Tax=Psychromarinibacter sp. S121 TaxID=3415127 RepID=UPI003C7DE985
MRPAVTVTWRSEDEPETPPISRSGWLRVGARVAVLVVMLAAGLVVLGLLRLAEWILRGGARVWSPYVVQTVSRGALVVLGIRLRVQGQPMRGQGGMVANHASWLDIFVLNAPARVTFVSKSEVANWPGIGFLARATGTIFIDRNARDAGRQRDILERQLLRGGQLVFFPEGTSTDGKRVLPFKSTLFAAFFTSGLPSDAAVQPVTVVYEPPRGEDPRYYGWWGDMEFGPHMLKLLASARGGAATVIYHAPLALGDYPDRKLMARECERRVRRGLALLPAK